MHVTIITSKQGVQNCTCTWTKPKSLHHQTQGQRYPLATLESVAVAVGGSTHHNDEGVHSSVKSFAQTIAFSWLGHVGTVQMWCILRQKLWCIGMPFVPFGRIAILCKAMVRVTIGSSRLVCIPFKYKEFLYLLSKVFCSQASFCLFSFFPINISIFTTNMCEKVSIQYAVLGFEPSTFRTWVSSHNH